MRSIPSNHIHKRSHPDPDHSSLCLRLLCLSRLKCLRLECDAPQSLALHPSNLNSMVALFLVINFELQTCMETLIVCLGSQWSPSSFTSIHCCSRPWSAIICILISTAGMLYDVYISDINTSGLMHAIHDPHETVRGVFHYI